MNKIQTELWKINCDKITFFFNLQFLVVYFNKIFCWHFSVEIIIYCDESVYSKFP